MTEIPIPNPNTSPTVDSAISDAMDAQRHALQSRQSWLREEMHRKYGIMSINPQDLPQTVVIEVDDDIGLWIQAGAISRTEGMLIHLCRRFRPTPKSDDQTAAQPAPQPQVNPDGTQPTPAGGSGQPPTPQS